MGTLAVLHLLYAKKPCLTFASVSVIWVHFFIAEHMYWMSHIIFTVLACSMLKCLTHTLCVSMCVCFELSLWCCFRTRHLIVSWFGTALGYMLDWLDDVTSTVSFCQLSGGVCYPANLYA